MRYLLTISGVLLSWTLPGLIEHIQVYVFLLVIGTVGMAHGSLDHLVHQSDSGGKVSMFRFYVLYLLATVLVAIIWWLNPFLGLALFAASSAYHFGQAEVPDRDFSSSMYLWVRRFSWGIALLTVPLIVHAEAFQLALQEWQIKTALHTLQISGWTTLLLALFFYFLSTWMAGQGKSNSISRLQDSPVASWTGYAFLLCVTPPLWGFTLYFGIWHAWPALVQVSRALQLSQARDWMKALLPNYLPSLLATLAWVWLASWWAPDYVVAGLLVLLSALTVPHTLVFERLYRKA